MERNVWGEKGMEGERIEGSGEERNRTERDKLKGKEKELKGMERKGRRGARDRGNEVRQDKLVFCPSAVTNINVPTP